MARLSVPVARRCAPPSAVSRVELLETRRLLHAIDHDPAMQKEHEAVFALVPTDTATHAAAQSGAWSDPATWAGGAVPAAGADVLVPEGVTVTVDAVETDPLRTVRVDGALAFATGVPTQLTVDTLVVSPSGSLTVGTADEPIAPDVTARVVIADPGPIDTAWDPNLLSRGVVSHGTTTVYGAARTPFAALASSAAKGATTLTLAQAPSGWRAGDALVLPGTVTGSNQDETLTVVSIDGATVTLNRPLSWAHAGPRPDLPVYVANLTRNVTFTSQNQAAGTENSARRGHVMLMHSADVDVNNAAFDHLGRTDKDVKINDPVLDADGKLVPGTGTNPRARYAFHLHRTGADSALEPSLVRGCVVTDSVGWGYVNHSSNAVFEDDVSYNVFGAGFVSEAGDEVGAFRHNLAIRSAGSGDGIESRVDVQDFGHEGNGFWFQGGGVEVEDNVATGQRRGAFVFFTRGLEQALLGTTRFKSANLPDPSIAGGEATVGVGRVPMRLFRDNYAYANGDGFESWFHLLNATHAARSTVENFTTWGNRTGRALFIPYTRHLTLRNVRALGSLTNPTGRGIDRNDVTNGIVIDNPRIEGFEIGIAAAKRGENLVRGGYLNNVQNVYVTGSMEAGRTVDVSAVRFGYLPPAVLKGRRQLDVFLRADLSPDDGDLAKVFGDEAVRVNGKQVYRAEQAADFVPYPAGAAETPAYVPPEVLGKTNRQLWDEYGMAVGGAVAPDGAMDVGRPRTNGLVGDATGLPPRLTLTSKKYTNKLAGYQLRYRPPGGAEVRDPQLVDLHEGWNLITRTVDGFKRTLLVFGDATPPTFRVTSALSIAADALAGGYTLSGYVADNSTGAEETSLTRAYNDLPTRPVQTRPDGTRFVALDLRITDKAGNATALVLELNVI